MQKYRVIATSLITYVSIVEAENEDQAGEIAFVQDNPDWEETGEADWQIDRVEPSEAEEAAPEPSKSSIQTGAVS